MNEVQYKFIKPYLESFGEGGEAYTYLIKHPRYKNMLAKVFKQKDLERNHKLMAMLEADYDKRILDFFAWPLQAIVENGEILGYIMKFEKADSVLKLLTGHSSSNGFKDQPRNRVTLVKNIYLALKIFKLNFPGSIFSDISLENILIKADGCPFFIDMDSIEYFDNQNYQRYKAKYYTDGYRSYEAIKGYPLNDSSDVFAISIITFKILMNGKHPFSAVPNINIDMTDFENNILHGYSAYLNISSLYEEPLGSLEIDEVMSQDLIACYDAELVTMRAYPDYRPKADDFFKIIEKMESEMHVCHKDRGHYYMQDHCPFCKHKQDKTVKSNIQIKIDDDQDNYTNYPQYQPYVTNYQANIKRSDKAEKILAYYITAVIFITIFAIFDFGHSAKSAYQMFAAVVFNIIDGSLIAYALAAEIDFDESYLMMIASLLTYFIVLAIVAYLSSLTIFLGLPIMIIIVASFLD